MTILKALVLLTQLGISDVPPVASIERAAGDSAQFSTRAFAGADGTIYLTAHGRKETDPRRVAALVAHERWHVLHGPDERPAYDEELRVLKALGVTDVTSVRRARAQLGGAR